MLLYLVVLMVVLVYVTAKLKAWVVERLLARTRDYATTPGVLRSELNYEIFRKFKEHGIEIPFLQRDLHIRSGVVEVKKARVPNPS